MTGATPSPDGLLAPQPGETDVQYAARLRALQAQVAARVQAAEATTVARPEAPAPTRPLRPSVRPEGRRAVGVMRATGPIGRAVRDAADRRAGRDRRVGTGDRRTGLADLRPGEERRERRARRRDRRTTRDRRWVSERRRSPGVLQDGGRSVGSSAVKVAAQLIFWVALIVLVLVILL